MRESLEVTAEGRPREDDAAMMRRVATGDAAACRLVVESHLRRIVNFSYKILGDSGDAEDVAQETFLRLWRQARRWRPEARLSTWLYRVARNLCIDSMRRRRDVPSEKVPEMPDPSCGAIEEHHHADLARAVDFALVSLPERQRTAITLVYHQELGNIEAAAVMGISVEALESLLARGRRRLRESLRDLRGDLIGDL